MTQHASVVCARAGVDFVEVPTEMTGRVWGGGEAWGAGGIWGDMIMYRYSELEWREKVKVNCEGNGFALNAALAKGD